MTTAFGENLILWSSLNGVCLFASSVQNEQNNWIFHVTLRHYLQTRPLLFDCTACRCLCVWCIRSGACATDWWAWYSAWQSAWDVERLETVVAWILVTCWLLCEDSLDVNAIPSVSLQPHYQVKVRTACLLLMHCSPYVVWENSTRSSGWLLQGGCVCVTTKQNVWDYYREWRFKTAILGCYQFYVSSCEKLPTLFNITIT